MPSSNKEEENYIYMMKIMNVAVCEGLRKIFKREWDRNYRTTKGAWDDTCISGKELYNMEKARRHAKQYLPLFRAGKRNEWDCSALFDAILYSNAIGKYLSPHVSNKVDELRLLRNKLVHSFSPQHKMPDSDFKSACKKIKGFFNVLKLSAEGVERIINSSKRNRGKRLWELIFVFITGLILSATIYWVTKSVEIIPKFRVLPTQPIHLIANRSRTVDAILQDLHNLSMRNNRSLTYMYISGNPGSGKSQLARLVGQRFEKIIPNSSFGTNTFVMTLNGRSLNDIYDSYVDFARRLHCSENEIASIVNSNKTTTATKTQSLKTEIAKKLTNYKNKCSWLLIVDNVVKLSEISSFLPQVNDEDWKGGQLLITTQDKSSVPPNSSLTVHISVSEGMNPAESCEFLTSLSGLVETQHSVSQVAKELDYQPLALASAAFYVKQLRESKVSPDFSWKDYLQKLNEGKRNLTETKLSKVNHAYSLTMSTTVLLAVTIFAESDPIIKHAFTFFSYVSYEPQSLEVVVSYVLQVDKEKDKEDVGLRILQCCLVLPLHDQAVVSISTHRVVHDSIKLYIAPDTAENNKSRIPIYVFQSLLQQKCTLGIALIPHLRAFSARTTNISSTLVPSSLKVKQEMQTQIFDLTSVLLQNGEFLLSKKLLILALKMAAKVRHNDKTNLVHVSFPKIGEIYINLGTAEHSLGNMKQARIYFKQALGILKTQHGRTHKSILTCYNNLASLSCSSSQECRRNIKYSKQALKISNDLETQGIYYCNLGRLYYDEGNLLVARENYKKANDIFGKMIPVCTTTSELKDTGMRLALISSNLGVIFYRLGDYKGGEKLLRNSINMYLEFTGPNHLLLGDSYYNLGLVHSKLNELREAENCFRNASEIYSRQLDPSHEMIARVSRELSGILEETGQLEDAGALREKYGTCRRH